MLCLRTTLAARFFVLVFGQIISSTAGNNTELFLIKSYQFVIVQSLFQFVRELDSNLIFFYKRPCFFRDIEKAIGLVDFLASVLLHAPSLT